MRNNPRNRNAMLFCGLCAAFLWYSFSLYRHSPGNYKRASFVRAKAVEGRLVWQKYNCQSCHQLYGLGGYLGPDLTNVAGKYNSNGDVLKFFFNGGIRQMPRFDMSEKEKNLLVEFLKFTDASGNADPGNYKVLTDGMIQQNGRK